MDRIDVTDFSNDKAFVMVPEKKMTSDLWLAKTHEAQTRLIRAEQNLEACKLAAERATSEKNRADCEVSNARAELTRLMVGKIDATELGRIADSQV